MIGQSSGPLCRRLWSDAALRPTHAGSIDLNRTNLSTVVLERAPDAELRLAWGDFLSRADFPTHYVAPEYFEEPDAAQRQYLAVLALQDARVVGVLTGERSDRHFIGGLTSRPQISFDKTEDKAVVAVSLVKALLARERRVHLVDICAWEPLPALQQRGFWQRATADGVVMLDLTKGPERLLAEMAGARRTDIKKGIKNGVEVREATAADVETYLQIREDWARRKGLPLPDRDLHRRMLERRNVRRLFVAVHEGQVIAGSVIRFCERGIMEYSANASVAEKMVFKPNDVLQWRIIEWGCARGFTRYSLDGSHPFLLKFGGEVIFTCAYRLDRSFLRRHRLREISVRAARAVFRRLPQAAQSRIRRLSGQA
jgi:GNAT acetyltransferase-like protein